VLDKMKKSGKKVNEVINYRVNKFESRLGKTEIMCNDIGRTIGQIAKDLKAIKNLE